MNGFREIEPAAPHPPRGSRARVWLRVAILCTGGGWMIWKGVQTHRDAPALGAGQALLASRMGWVQILVGVLCLATAGVLVSQLRRRRRRQQTLRLKPPPS